jgi:hypothetical protein
MLKNISASRILKIYLVLVALHSFCVGVGLIFMPTSQMAKMGFNITENFFPDQGGVFHIIMCIAYILPVIDVKKYFTFIVFTIIVKFLATIFLFIYYIFIDQILMVLISGIFDFLIGLVLLFIYNWFNKSELSNINYQQ